MATTNNMIRLTASQQDFLAQLINSYVLTRHYDKSNPWIACSGFHPHQSTVMRAVRKFCSSKHLRRVRCSREIAIALMIGGVEMNPGPPSSPQDAATSSEPAHSQLSQRFAELRGGSAVQRHYAECRRAKKAQSLKTSCKSGARKLEEALKEQRAALQVEQDAAKQAAAETEAEQRRQTQEFHDNVHAVNDAFFDLSSETIERFCVRSAQAGTENLGYAGDILASLFPSSIVTPDCALRPEDLTLCNVPHNISFVERTQLLPNQVFGDALPPPPGLDVHGDGTQILTPDFRLPIFRDRSQLPKHDKSKVLMYTVELTSVGFFGQPVVGAGIHREVVSLSRELLLEAMRRRLASSGEFTSTYMRVVAFRANTHHAQEYDYSITTHSRASDLVFTALLLLSYRAESRAQTLGGTVEKELSRLVLHSLNAAQPLAGGSYVVGYNVPLTSFTDNIAAGASVVIDEAKANARCTLRRAMAHCVLGPVHVPDFVPTFPNPHDAVTVAAGALKRLVIEPISRVSEAARRELYASRDRLIARIPACPTIEPALTTWRRGLEHVKHARMTESDSVDYLCGVVMCIRHSGRSIDLADIGVDPARRDVGPEGHILTMVTVALMMYQTGSIKDLLDAWRTGAFIKSETYPPDDVKAPRFIVAPGMVLRGYSQALMGQAQDHFFEHMPDCVKHLNASQITEKLMEKFGSVKDIIETDYSSFESSIRSFHLRELEMPVILASLPEQLRGLGSCLLGRFSEDQVIEHDFLKIVTSAFRLSGTYQTSWGNFIQNNILCHAMFARLMGKNVEEVELLALFEGDDGVVAVPPEVVGRTDELTAIAGEYGARLKCEHHVDVTEANFCGNTLHRIKAYMKEGFGVAESCCKVVDPREVLSRAFSLFDVPDHTDRGRLQLEVAKWMSYYLLYSGLPLVGPVLRALLNRFRGERSLVMDHLLLFESEKRDIPLHRFYSRLSARGRLEEFHSYWDVHRGVLEEVPVDEGVAEHCAALSKWGVDAMAKAEKEILKAIAKGKTTLNSPTLVDSWQHLKGVAKMTVHNVEDARKKIVPTILRGKGIIKDASDQVHNALLSPLIAFIRRGHDAFLAHTLWVVCTLAGLLTAGPIAAMVGAPLVGPALLAGCYAVLASVCVVLVAITGMTLLVAYGLTGNFRRALRAACLVDTFLFGTLVYFVVRAVMIRTKSHSSAAPSIRPVAMPVEATPALDRAGRLFSTLKGLVKHD